VIAGTLVVLMLALPERAAGVLQLACYGPGFLLATLFAGLMALMPGALAYTFSRTVVETFPRWLQIVTLLVWVLALAVTSALLYSGPLRRAVRQRLEARWPERVRDLDLDQRMSPWLAVVLYVNFVLVAMGCFASIAFLLHELTPPLFLAGARPVDHGSLADFLLWHVLDAIPGLKVPDTLRWAAPLTYERSGAGWLLLLFKIMVIVPVVSGIGHYLREERAAGAPG
jgi:hypothetical protein